MQIVNLLPEKIISQMVQLSKILSIYIWNLVLEDWMLFSIFVLRQNVRIN